MGSQFHANFFSNNFIYVSTHLWYPIQNHQKMFTGARGAAFIALQQFDCSIFVLFKFSIKFDFKILFCVRLQRKFSQGKVSLCFMSLKVGIRFVNVWRGKLSTQKCLLFLDGGDGGRGTMVGKRNHKREIKVSRSPSQDIWYHQRTLEVKIVVSHSSETQ